MNVPTITQANLTSSYVVPIDQPVPTAIADIPYSPSTLSNPQSTIYDLHGRKVSELKKGIYIKNGRKVVVK